AELGARVRAAIGDDTGSFLTSRHQIRVINAERLIDVAMPCRASIQQRSAGNRSHTSGNLAPLERVRGKRTSSYRRQPPLDTADVYAFLKIRRCNRHVSSDERLRARDSGLKDGLRPKLEAPEVRSREPEAIGTSAFRVPVRLREAAA